MLLSYVAPALALSLPTLPDLGTGGCVWRSKWGSSICQKVLKSVNVHIPEKIPSPNAHFLHLKTFANSFRLFQEAIPAHSSEKWFLLFSISGALNLSTMHLSRTIYSLHHQPSHWCFSTLSTLPLSRVYSHFGIFPMNNNNSENNNNSHLLTA